VEGEISLSNTPEWAEKNEFATGVAITTPYRSKVMVFVNLVVFFEVVVTEDKDSFRNWTLTRSA
jgi:hypothetical protein